MRFSPQGLLRPVGALGSRAHSVGLSPGPSRLNHGDAHEHLHGCGLQTWRKTSFQLHGAGLEAWLAG